MKKRRTKVFIIILVVVLIAAVGTAVLADYTKSSRAKRVAVNAAGHGALFSSNYLEEINNTLNVHPNGTEVMSNKRYAYAIEGDTQATATVTICNYAQGDENEYYELNDIGYTLHAQLVNSEGVPISSSGTVLPEGYQVKVQLVHDDGTTETEKIIGYDGSTLNADYANDHTWISTLSRSASSKDQLTVTFNNAALSDRDNIFLMVWAERSSDYPGTKDLCTMLNAAFAGKLKPLAWTGSFNENTDSTEENKPKNYDGFNYVLEGTGKGVVSLTWDPALIRISEHSLEKVLGVTAAPEDITVDSTPKKRIKIAVDSDDQSRYDIQLYRANDVTDTAYAGWVWSDSVLKTSSDPSGIEVISFGFDLFDWKGAVAESDLSPAGMTSFGYTVEGTGKGWVEVKWNRTKISVTGLPSGSITTDEGDYRKARFNVDSDSAASYTLTISTEEDTSAWTWDTVRSYISYTSQATVD